MVRGSNPGGDKIFCTGTDRPWGPSSLLYNGYRVSFAGIKRAETGVDHPLHLASKLKKEYIHTSAPTLSLRGVLQGELCLPTNDKYNCKTAN
jgi:hypothetical protein